MKAESKVEQFLKLLEDNCILMIFPLRSHRPITMEQK